MPLKPSLAASEKCPTVASAPNGTITPVALPITVIETLGESITPKSTVPPATSQGALALLCNETWVSPQPTTTIPPFVGMTTLALSATEMSKPGTMSSMLIPPSNKDNLFAPTSKLNRVPNNLTVSPPISTVANLCAPILSNSPEPLLMLNTAAEFKNATSLSLFNVRNQPPALRRIAKTPPSSLRVVTVTSFVIGNL